MENYQGDLADIVRATGGGSKAESGLTNGGIGGQQLLTNWQQLIMSNPLEQVIVDEFGDPFSNARDPLLNGHLDMAAATGSCFFDSSINNNNIRSSNNLDDNPVRFDGDGDGAGGVGGCGGGNNSILISPKIGDEEIIRRGGAAGGGGGGDNIFSRMLQISPSATNKLSSPCDSPAASAATAPSPSRGGLKVNSSTKSSFVENDGVQISSPSSTGIKRRKSQAKKVVCIPAPTPANSRPAGGEVVPSDLWAWRKYGQKPIKGSPYPRGYYRCSSSKGCSARKQVERSRTDPNMLVITYTSEHNHPWPTQRNALAGSTRSQPSHKTGSSSSSKTTAIATATAAQKTAPPPPPPPPTPTTNLKEEQQKVNNNNNSNNNISSSIVTSDQTTVLVKEEMEMEMEMDDVDEFSEGGGGFQEESYRPSMLSVENSNRCSEDFFADLGELETDPLNLLLFTTTTTQGGGGYSGEEGRENHHNNNNSNDNKEASQQLDPFTFYDWTSTDSNVNSQGNNYLSSIQGDSNKGS